jgi:hypothetical protein
MFNMPRKEFFGLRRTVNLLGLVVVGLLCCATLAGCESTELNTLSATALPIRSGPILVVYELANLDRRRVPPADDPSRVHPVTIYEFFSNSVEREIPSILQQKGFGSAFTMRALGNVPMPPGVVAEIPPEQIDNRRFTHELRIRVAKDTEVCKDAGRCSHQLTARASIVRSGSDAVLWSTEIREPSVTPLVIDAYRLDTLARQLAEATLRVIRPAN